MKLRVKVRASGSRHSVTIDPPEEGEPKLEHVKTAIFRQIPSLSDVDTADALVLSLNGSAPLDNDDEDTASEMGLVSGDLIHVLNGPNPASANAAATAPPSHQSPPAPSSSSGIQRENRPDQRDPIQNRAVDSATGRSAESLNDAESEEFLPRASYTLLNADERRSHLTFQAPCAEYIDGHALPTLLGRVYDEEKPSTKIELVLVLVHVVFLEKNFTALQSGDAVCVNGAGIRALPSDWKQKAPNKVDISYRHPKRGDDVEFLVTFINLFGNVVIVQAKSRTRDGEETESFKWQIKPDECLTESCLTTVDSSQKYRNLRRFSTSLLDSVVNRLLIGSEDEDASLLSLPFDVSVVIMAMLDFRSLARMTRVNKFFRDYCASSQFLWKGLFVRDFSAIPVGSVDDWKREYKETYLRRKAIQERRGYPPWRDPLPHNPFNDDNPFAPTFPFAPPGFLGGDRDLFPEGMPLSNDPFGVGRGLFQPQRPPRPGWGPQFPGGPNRPHPRWPGRGGGGFLF